MHSCSSQHYTAIAVGAWLQEAAVGLINAGRRDVLAVPTTEAAPVCSPKPSKSDRKAARKQKKAQEKAQKKAEVQPAADTLQLIPSPG